MEQDRGRERARVDDEIRAALADGDLDAAATAGLRAHGSEIYRYLRGVVRDDDAARDAFSQFSENMWRSLPRFRGDSSFRTWAYRLAWCAAIDLLRQGRRKREDPLASSQFSQLAERIRTATPSHLGQPMQDRFAALREGLDPEDRSLLALRVEQGLSWREVTEVMARDDPDLEAATLRKRFERLKRRLRDLLGPGGPA